MNCCKRRPMLMRGAAAKLLVPDPVGCAGGGAVEGEGGISGVC